MQRFWDGAWTGTGTGQKSTHGPVGRGRLCPERRGIWALSGALPAYPQGATAVHTTLPVSPRFQASLPWREICSHWR